ncbi:alpha-mannosidase [Agromyces sp. MMS24-JH15]|uniref:alpha-mannosidase n=1 Tax=Agromyces sp. MMS24-JH15 TaxID=3243765 RepID=UPI003747D094
MQGFPAFVFGLAARQPTEYRRLRDIRRRIYTRVAPLHAEIVRSPEPIPFADLDRSAFRPLREGAAWGRVFDCAWLRITGEVPASLRGDAEQVGDTSAAGHPLVMLGIRGEGLVVGPDGRVLDSVSTVFQQGDHPHPGGRFRPVAGVDASGDRVEFYADVAYNGWILYEVGRAAYHGAFLATRDDDAYALYFDYLALVLLAEATEDAALAAEVRRALGAAWGRFRAGDVRGARAELAPALASPSASDFTYDAVGHGHLDMAWLWPLRETRRKAARTYVRALNAIDRRPDYVYGTSQPQQMHWMKHEQPELFERMRRAVAAGRMELQGSFWVEPDTNMPTGEALVRQALVGRRFLQDEFGLTDEQLRLCWLPDTFGYSGNLPQILRGAGMDWFQTIKLAWNKVNDFPHRTFQWQGIDGSTVLVHMPPEGDYNSRAGADNLLTGLRQYPERDLGTALLVYGSGDGGGGPNEIHHELLDRERGIDGQGLRGLPRVRLSSAGDFFRRLEQRDIPHTHTGELYLETHQGTYTTQAQIKRRNRLVERKLHDAEALAVLTGDDHRPVLEPHWRDVLLNQFHDILPGSSIARVNREAIETYERIERALDTYAAGLVARLPGADASNPAGRGAPTESTRLETESRGLETRPRSARSLLDQRGASTRGLETRPRSARSLLDQRGASTRGLETRPRSARSLLDQRGAGTETHPPRAALNLTSFARDEVVRVDDRWYRAQVAPYAASVLEPIVGEASGFEVGDDTLSNGVVTLRFGADGEIASFRDRDGREHAAAAGGLNRLVVHRDPYVWPFNAWDIDPRYVERTPRVLRMRHLGTVVDGPTVVRTHEHRSRSVTVRQRIVLEAGSDVVRFETEVDWHERHRMLRAEFRPARFGDTVRCEIQFGHLERTTLERDAVERAQFEVVAHKWIATEDADGGFALLNDGKYGHRAKHGLLSLNLLRAPTFPDRTADRGIHRFTYAITPYATGDLRKAIREGYRLNNPLRPIVGAGFASAASVDEPGVVIETVKRAEHGDGVVLRLYESLGRPTTTALRVDLPGLPDPVATETDLLERPTAPADLARLAFRPFEIKTILLEERR